MRGVRATVAAVACVVSIVAAGCTTPPTGPGGPGSPTVLAVVGDYGYDHEYIDTLSGMVHDWSPDYVLTTGDNVQIPLPITGTARYDRLVGRHFCEFMANVAPGPYCPSGGDSAVNRFFPATGNHDHTQGDIANYQAYFDLPGAGVASTRTSGSELFYDVVLGSVHAFVLDSEPMYQERNLPAAQRTLTNRQSAWLQQAMSASTARWQVVVLHDPPYGSSATYGSAGFVQLPYAAWGADLVLNGHAAVYERVHRDGIPYITNGLGGGAPSAFTTPVTGSVVRFNQDVAVGTRLTATASSLRIEAIAVDGRTIDTHSLG